MVRFDAVFIVKVEFLPVASNNFHTGISGKILSFKPKRDAGKEKI